MESKITAFIYKIINIKTGLIYIGSTQRSLSTRLSEHVTKYNRRLKYNSISTTSFKIFENAEKQDYYIESIKKIEVNNQKMILIEEGNVIREYKAQYPQLVVNRMIAGRTSKQYHIDNREKRIRIAQEHNKKNIEKYKAYQKEYQTRYRQILKDQQAVMRIMIN